MPFKAARKSFETLPAMKLDPYSAYIEELLSTRQERLANKDEPIISRDELIETLSLPGHDIISDNIQCSRNPDDRIINLIDDDNIDETLKLANLNRDISIGIIKRMDRQKFRLPIHFRTVIDLSYYQKLSMQCVAERMTCSLSNLVQMKQEAITELARLLRMENDFR